MSNRIKKQEDTRTSFQDNTAMIMAVFTVAVLCLLPIVITNFYFNILETKYQFYCGCAIIMILVMGGYGLCSGRMEMYFKKIHFKELMKGLGVTDWAMLAFWFCNVVSMLSCMDRQWLPEAFWGTSGRYNGVFLMTIYMIVYFLTTRFFRFRRWYLDAFLAVSLFICLFGITDYFQMDLLHFKVRMYEEQKGIYTSTLGNINTYTAYVGMVLAISVILFALEKNRKKMLWYYINIVVSSFALIMGTSDNAYLSLAVLFGLSPLYLFRTGSGLRRYMISLASFFTVIQCIAWLNAANSERVQGIEGAFNLIANLGALPLLIIGLWLAAGAAAVVTMKREKSAKSDDLGHRLVYPWLALVIIVSAAVAFVIFDANIAGNAGRYDAIRSYVVFDDNWGTERGYVWRRCIELYRSKFDTFQKLFGCGADTFRLLIQRYYETRIQNGQYTVYDSAHNEYLHFLVTIGLCGMLSYLAFMGSAVAGMCRKIKQRPEVAAVMFAVAAYMFQALVNINLPITMPIVLHFVAMGLGKQGEEKA